MPPNVTDSDPFAQVDTLRVAIAGAPNTGKTTVFNGLTGAFQHVANFPGVTVETKATRARVGKRQAVIIDLPGMYSFTALTEDERIARRFLLDGGADIIVNVVDAGNLERNLFLTVQLLELGLPVVVCLNMVDRANTEGITIDADKLSRLLGVPVIPTAARSGAGLTDLKAALLEDTPSLHSPTLEVDYGAYANPEIEKLASIIRCSSAYPRAGHARFLAVKLLEGDSEVESELEEIDARGELSAALTEYRASLRAHLGEEFAQRLTEHRLGYVSGIARMVLSESLPGAPSLTDRIDRYLTHPVLGVPIFLLVMWILFAAVFILASPLVGSIQAGVDWLQAGLEGRLGGGMIESLALDGILGGVGAVGIFVPNIFLLFLGIAILEDSGYLARAAFIMERGMSRLGLPGRAFLPLVMGFGCNVPAIMATRVIGERRGRILSILVIPLVTCSARMPVYILLIGAFFPAVYAGSILWGMYILSAVFVALIAKLFSSILFKGEMSPMILELPPYLQPTLNGILLHAWRHTRHYLTKAFTFILAGAVIVWFAVTFPVSVSNAELDGRIQAIETDYLARIASAPAIEKESLSSERDEALGAAKLDAATENILGSLAGWTGRILEPVLSPLGFDWRIGIGLLGGVLAKEIVISTLGVIYNVNVDVGSDTSLRGALASATRGDGAPAYSPLTAFSLMIFVLLYVPCVATLAVQRKELAGTRWFPFAATYTTVLAYIVSLIVYQGGRLLGFA